MCMHRLGFLCWSKGVAAFQQGFNSEGGVGTSSGSSARSSEHPKKQEPEPAEPAERAEAADDSKTKTVLTGWAKLFGGPSAADPAPRKGNKGTSKGSKGKQPTNPREVRVPKTSGKGSTPSSPEPQGREEACAQEPEPVHAHH